MRWRAGDEDQHEVDHDAIKRALADAAGVQLEARFVPIVRSRAEGLAAYFDFYNARRPHRAHAGQTPDVVYFAKLEPLPAAA